MEVVEGIVTQAPDRHEQVTESHGPHRGEAGYRGKGHKGQRASVTWKGGGGARSNAGRIQDDTDNPQNHNHNAAPNRRRQERGQMKN